MRQDLTEAEKAFLKDLERWQEAHNGGPLTQIPNPSYCGTKGSQPMNTPENCPPDCPHRTFHYCGAVGTRCDRYCTCTCEPCRGERARLNSIGLHFFALAPAEQAYRIVTFAEALWLNEALTLQAFGDAIRRALRSMDGGEDWTAVIRIRSQFVLIETKDYSISSAPEGTFIVELRRKHRKACILHE